MKLHDGIDSELAAWITAQPLFFVASAPLSANGHVNLSARGLDGLQDDRRRNNRRSIDDLPAPD